MSTASAKNRNGKSSRTPDQHKAELIDRMPPADSQAERAVLGSVLLLPDSFDALELIIQPDDFFDPTHQTIYRVARDLYFDTGVVDVALLVSKLSATGDLAAIGGAASLAEIAREVPTAAHAEHYARIVHEQAMRRGLIKASMESLRDAYDQGVDTDTLLSRAEQGVFALQDRKQVGMVCDIRDALVDSLARMDRSQRGETRGVPTGYFDFDRLCGGLQESELTILAARPSMGKTALAMNIAQNMATEERGVFFVSLEMSQMELADRFLCAISGVSSQRMRNGRLSTDDRMRITEAAAEVSRWPMRVADKASQTLSEVAANARRLKRAGDLQLIVIDYLQLIEPDNPRDPRQEQVAKIARRLKMLAKDLKVPVLCLSQLNRQTETSRDNKPKLSHLRESGAIEQDADVVLFIHREEYYQTNEEDRQRVAGEAELIIAKQRNGPVGEVRLAWRRDVMRFENAQARNHQQSFDAYNRGEDF